MKTPIGMIALTWSLILGVGLQASENLRVASFQIDATPPLGSPLCNGGVKPAREIVTPLTARGVILFGAGDPIALCAFDWVGIANESHQAFRETIARSLGTTPDRVAVHTLHQHDAPGSDLATERLLTEHGLGGLFSNAEFDREVMRRLETSVQNALSQTRSITHIGLGKGTVDRVASNRRILGPEGKVILQRQSAGGKNVAAREAPEGVIDPDVRLISFWNEDQPLAVMTYYATHPQSYYGQGLVNWDFVGMARQIRADSLPGVHHTHFNGAGGNVAAGKYNDGSISNRPILAQRLSEGMKTAWETQKKFPLTSADVGWQVANVSLPVRESLDQDLLIGKIKDSRLPQAERLRAARDWTFVNRMREGKQIAVGCLRLGDARVLHLPGELFVEYQLAAQQMAPNQWVAMAAYGDYGSGYIGTEIAYSQGGYETGIVSRVSPKVEAVLLTAMRSLLQSANEKPAKEKVTKNQGGSSSFNATIAAVDETKKSQVGSKQPDYPDRLNLLVWKNQQGEYRPITQPSDWERRREQILHNMQRVMGTVPVRDAEVGLDVQVLEVEILEKVTRKKITYLAGKGDRIPAYLLIPNGVRQPTPAVICLHGTSGSRGRTAGIGPDYPRYTLELAERGYVTIAPDYTLLGDNQTDPESLGYTSGTMKGIWSHMRAVDLLTTLPEVDRDRIGCCGVSLGGHNALFLAAFDLRMKVTVCSSGFDSFADYMDGNLTGWCQKRYMPAIASVYGKVPDQLPFDFPEVLAAIAPRPLYIHAPLEDSNFKVASARKCVDAAAKVYRLLGAEEKLVANYPPGPHGYPIEERERSYTLIDQVLKLAVQP